jgi:hypothetical protein
MKKPIALTRVIELPRAGIADRLSIDANGKIQIYDHSGNLVVPMSDERSMSYERPKGVKYQSKSVSQQGYASLSGLEELSRLESFFAIDTNTRVVQGVRISVAFFIQCKLVFENSGFRCVVYEKQAHAFEFHDVQGNPELLAILFLSSMNQDRCADGQSARIGIITDSDLKNHAAYASQEIPIYDGHHLPVGFCLFYASSDTGREITNLLLKVCDRHSSLVLEKLGGTRLTKEGFLPCPPIPSISYRHWKFPVLERNIGIFSGVSIPSGSTYTIQFHE